MTSTGNHHKHPPLAKPSLGEWGRNEVAILGAPCSVIRTLAESISSSIQPSYTVCYIDADHADEHEHVSIKFNATYSDKIHSRRLDIAHDPSMFSRRALLSGQDLILVNGNHFTAKEQIVLLHSKKLESLQRKLDRLTHVICVIEYDVSLADCAFLDPFISTKTQVFRTDEQRKLPDWLLLRTHTPLVRGLLLAGGKSARMGTDKSLIKYHGIPHRDYMIQLLADIGLPAYISCRADQVNDMKTDAEIITDRFFGLGPYGAILSAMMSAPDDAWLVLATDLPLVTEETLRELVKNRNHSKIATAFHNPVTNFPEPLITLWEPKAYPVLLSFLAQGNVCPRKALINSDIQLVEPADPNWLRNANTPEDVDSVRTLIA